MLIDFSSGQYLFPHDEKERDRLDIMHTMIKVARPPGRRFTHCPTEGLHTQTTPLGARPRILDLGCGTGIWLIEMAENFPQAELVGVDMHYMTPPTQLSNVSFRAPWDYESPWSLGEASWDLIHLQMGLGSVSDWEGLYQKILRHLVPGKGWVELVEIDFKPRCDDGTLQDGMLVDWWRVYIRAPYEAINRRLDYNEGTQALLEHVGFTDIQHAVYRIPYHEWSNVPDTNVRNAENRAATWWHIAMSSNGDDTGGFGFEAMSLAPLCRINHWSVDHVKRLCNEALAQATDPNVHAYSNLHIWWARRPDDDGS